MSVSSPGVMSGSDNGWLSQIDSFARTFAQQTETAGVIANNIRGIINGPSKGIITDTAASKGQTTFQGNADTTGSTTDTGYKKYIPWAIGGAVVLAALFLFKK